MDAVHVGDEQLGEQAGRPARHGIGHKREQALTGGNPVALLHVSGKARALKLYRIDADVQQQFEPGAVAVEPKLLAPKKADTAIEEIVLVWTPWARGPRGMVPLAT